MSIPTDISHWIHDSHQQLAQAQKICNEANKYITLTTEKLTSREDKLPKLIYYLDSEKQQLRLLGIIKDSLNLSLNEILGKKTNLKNRINKDVDKLLNTVKTLKHIKIDQSFNREETTLFEFISEEELSALFYDINENLRETDELIKNNRTDALLIRLHSDLDNLNNEFNGLNTQFHDLKLDDINNSNDPINKLLVINNELEIDMVSILESFNNHHDQCLKGDAILQDPTISKTEKLELISVLHNDVNELPSVMKFLNNDCEIIIKNCKEINKIVNFFEIFYVKVESFLKDLEKYGELKLVKQLEEFTSINNSLVNKISKSEEYKQSISQYIHDYTQFISSYYSLVLELDRRSKINLKVEALIEKFKMSLNDLISDDFEKRIEFLDLNGDYLPQNLIDMNLISKSTPKVEINFDVEVLPVLSTETINEAKRNI